MGFLGITPEAKLYENRIKMEQEMRDKGASEGQIAVAKTLDYAKGLLLHGVEVAPLFVNAPIKLSLLAKSAVIGAATGGLKLVEEALQGDEPIQASKQAVVTGATAGTIYGVLVWRGKVFL